MGRYQNDIEALKDAKHEASCMALDLGDAIGARAAEDIEPYLREAIRRHALIANYLRNALTIVARRRRVLSMAYPANLGGGCGLDAEGR